MAPQAEIATAKTEHKKVKLSLFEYVTLDEVRAGKAKLTPSKNLKLERFKIKIPSDIDITAIAYERENY